MEAGESLELARGDFILARYLDENVCLATVVLIEDDVQWPLKNDEPSVKLEALHYLFSLQMETMESHSWRTMEAVWAFWSHCFVSTHVFLRRQHHQLEVHEILSGKSLLQMLNIITIFRPRLLLDIMVRLSTGSSIVALLPLARFSLITDHCFFRFLRGCSGVLVKIIYEKN